VEPKGYFVIEISSFLDFLYITAFSSFGPESFVINFKNQEAKDVLQMFGNDFSMMAMCLSFHKDRMVLKNPRNLLKS
jgi:hypothetical protein